MRVLAIRFIFYNSSLILLKNVDSDIPHSSNITSSFILLCFQRYTKYSKSHGTSEAGLTSHQNVYAGGDAVTGAATVILAMGAGKLGAKSIDEALSK